MRPLLLSGSAYPCLRRVYMAKKVMANVKLQIPGGEAKPSPPVGPALGQHGVNIMEFCKAFNAQTQKPARCDHPRADYHLR